LKLAQFPHQRVIRRIGDLWRIEHVILVFVVADLFAQLVDSRSRLLSPLLGLRFGLGHTVHYRKQPVRGESGRLEGAVAFDALKEYTVSPKLLYGVMPGL